MNYIYNEYINVRKNNLFQIINEKISTLNNEVDIEELLYDVLDQYQEFLNAEILSLYKKAGIDVEAYDIYNFVYEVKDKEIRRNILMIIEEIHLIFSVINRFHEDPFVEDKKNKTIDNILSTIDSAKRREILNMIEHYENLSNEKIKFVDSGTVTNVFSAGSKIIKFGPIRRYENIPFCLEIEKAIQYSDYLFCYVTEKIAPGVCSDEEARNMYFLLRDKGYVWLDVKADNLGIKNGEIRILDDVDIFSVEDIYKLGKYSILDFVSFNLNLALLEIDWMRRKTNNFDIDSISECFNDITKIQLIERLKDEYIKHSNKYEYDIEKENSLFISLLGKKIEELNLIDDAINR